MPQSQLPSRGPLVSNSRGVPAVFASIPGSSSRAVAHEDNGKEKMVDCTPVSSMHCKVSIVQQANSQESIDLQLQEARATIAHLRSTITERDEDDDERTVSIFNSQGMNIKTLVNKNRALSEQINRMIEYIALKQHINQNTANVTAKKDLDAATGTSKSDLSDHVQPPTMPTKTVEEYATVHKLPTTADQPPDPSQDVATVSDLKNQIQYWQEMHREKDVELQGLLKGHIASRKQIIEASVSIYRYLFEQYKAQITSGVAEADMIEVGRVRSILDDCFSEKELGWILEQLKRDGKTGPRDDLSPLPYVPYSIISSCGLDMTISATADSAEADTSSPAHSGEVMEHIYPQPNDHVVDSELESTSAIPSLPEETNPALPAEVINNHEEVLDHGDHEISEQAQHTYNPLRIHRQQLVNQRVEVQRRVDAGIQHLADNQAKIQDLMYRNMMDQRIGMMSARSAAEWNVLFRLTHSARGPRLQSPLADIYNWV